MAARRKATTPLCTSKPCSVCCHDCSSPSASPSPIRQSDGTGSPPHTHTHLHVRLSAFSHARSLPTSLPFTHRYRRDWSCSLFFFFSPLLLSPSLFLFPFFFPQTLPCCQADVREAGEKGREGERERKRVVDDEWRDKKRRGDPGTAMEETWREATGG